MVYNVCYFTMHFVKKNKKQQQKNIYQKIQAKQKIKEEKVLGQLFWYLFLSFYQVLTNSLVYDLDL